jgi:hypothetical protein
VSGVGRNSPCPCGSGRKHKACCLSLLETAAREDREVDGVFQGMVDWISEECPELYEEAGELTRFERLMRGPLMRRHYSLWAMIDYRPSDDGPPLAARYATRVGISPAEQACAERIAGTKLGVHRVLDVVPGIWLDLQAVAGDEPVRAIAPLASTHTQAGDIILTRLIFGSPAPSIWGAGAVFETASAGKWTRHVETLPVDHAEAALALLNFHPDGHAEPLVDRRGRISTSWTVYDDELVLDALEEDSLFESLGQEIGGGWAFAWSRGDRHLRAAESEPDDVERDELARIVVDRDLLTVYAINRAVSEELAAHLARELRGLAGEAGGQCAA